MFLKLILTNQLVFSSCCKSSAVAPVYIAKERIVLAKPFYGQLLSADTLHVEAVMQAQTLYDRVWREKNADYVAQIATALEDSRVDARDLERKSFFVDPDMNLILSGSHAVAEKKQTQFLVHKIHKTFYDDQEHGLEGGSSLHDLQKFNDLLTAKVLHLSATLPPTPLSSPRKNIGPAMITTCGHFFCQTCLEVCAEKFGRCAVCREGLSKSTARILLPSQIPSATSCNVCKEDLDLA